MASTKNNPLVSLIDRRLDTTNFRDQHWEGNFWEYLDVVADNPTVARNAFQRVYDMILSYGSESFTQFKQEYTRYKFFRGHYDFATSVGFDIARIQTLPQGLSDHLPILVTAEPS